MMLYTSLFYPNPLHPPPTAPPLWWIPKADLETVQYACCRFHGTPSRGGLPQNHLVYLVSRLVTPRSTVYKSARFANYFRPISLLALSLLRLLDSNFPGNPLWTWEFHPFKIILCLSRTFWNPQSWKEDWAYQGSGGFVNPEGARRPHFQASARVPAFPACPPHTIIYCSMI